METRLTINQLEKMKTHELADMLANVVLLLRRMPDVECKQFLRQVPGPQDVEQPAFEQVSAPATSFTREELEKKNLDDLKTLAKTLNVRVYSKIKKEKLIADILASAADGHSEQPTFEQVAAPAASFTREELAKKKVDDLQTLAKELNVFVPASAKRKDDLIARILAKSADGHSEQRAIQDM